MKTTKVYPTIKRVNENKVYIENDIYKVLIRKTIIGIEYMVYPKLKARGDILFAPKLNCGVESREFDGVTIQDAIDIIRPKLTKIEEDDYNSSVFHYKWNGHIIYTAQKVGAGEYMLMCSGNNLGVTYYIDAYDSLDGVKCMVKSQFSYGVQMSSPSQYEIGEVK